MFIVVKVLKTEPQNYIIKDLNGEEIKGTFYNEELSRYDSELYEIEKVLKRKKDKFLVKWKGYEKPSWIDSQIYHRNKVVNFILENDTCQCKTKQDLIELKKT